MDPNPDKEALNVIEHGYTFDHCEAIFDGPTFTKVDRSVDYDGEERLKVTGIVEGVVMVLVYTERGDELRPISYREALPHEITELEKHYRHHNRSRRR